MHHHEGAEPRRLLVPASVLEQGVLYDLLGGAPVGKRTGTAAGADQLVAVLEGKKRSVAHLDSQRSRSQEQFPEAPQLGGERRAASDACR